MIAVRPHSRYVVTNFPARESEACLRAHDAICDVGLRSVCRWQAGTPPAPKSHPYRTSSLEPLANTFSRRSRVRRAPSRVRIFCVKPPPGYKVVSTTSHDGLALSRRDLVETQNYHRFDGLTSSQVHYPITTLLAFVPVGPGASFTQNIGLPLCIAAVISRNVPSWRNLLI